VKPLHLHETEARSRDYVIFAERLPGYTSMHRGDKEVTR